jgi:hypothetical protein
MLNHGWSFVRLFDISALIINYFDYCFVGGMALKLLIAVGTQLTSFSFSVADWLNMSSRGGVSLLDYFLQADSRGL